MNQIVSDRPDVYKRPLAQADAPVISVEHLSVDLRVPSGTLHALSDVSLSIRRGETLALVGESGCGKTMTSLAVMGLLPDSATRRASKLDLEGTDLLHLTQRQLSSVRGERMAMVFQDPLTALNPVYTIGDQLEETFVYHGRGGRREGRARAEYMLSRVGISAPRERMSQYPHQLSGGLRQRVVIAMALMREPALIIADEPTTALDVTIQAQILALLGDLQKEFNTALMLITHDMGVVARMADRVAVMYAGRIVEEGTVANVFRNSRHPYTSALMSCIPDIGRKGNLGSIPGIVPSLVGEHEGCMFRDRCDWSMPGCARGDIELIEREPAHAWRCVLPDGASKDAGLRAPDEYLLPSGEPTYAVTTENVLEVRGVGRQFASRRGILGKSRHMQAVEDIDLDLKRGEVLAIVGESGSGKTTLARMLLGLLTPSVGTIRFDGRPIEEFRVGEIARRIQPIFQDPYSSLNPRKTVGQIIAAPMEVRGEGSAARRRARLHEMMQLVGLPSFLVHSYPSQLSGGQRQRVAIARALIMRPDVVICDEPTSALDVSVQAQILNLLNDLRKELGVTYIFISHDLSVIHHMADRAAVMYLGRIVEMGTIDEIFDSPQHPYTQALLASALTPDPDLGLPEVRLGRGMPDPFNKPSGCYFRTRCPVAFDTCTDVRPDGLTVIGRLVECHLAAAVGNPASRE